MQTALLLLLLSPAASLAPSWQYEYQGTLRDRDESAPKRFTLHSVVTAGGVYWSLEETGAGQWPWSSRFGKLTGGDDLGPALLYQQDDVTGVVELISPHFSSPEDLSDGAAWQSNGREYRASREGEHWRVRSVDAYGNKESLLIDGEQPLVRQMRRDVVLGRGERFVVDLSLKDSKRLDEQQLKQARDEYEQMLALRDELSRPERVRNNQWTKPQLETLRGQLPEAAGFGLTALVQEAQKDVRNQGVRANAVKTMAKDAIGKTPQFDLPASTRNAPRIDSEDLEGKVVVLHFWSYRSKPLEEPYGQVGYLDFLWRKLPQEKLAVIGVAVHNDDIPESEAANEARKMAEFMNVSFPVAVDSEGKLLEQLGDPRAAEAELPLFVVLDPQGKVIHYHVGHYEVDTREGLKELRAIVLKALGD